MLIITKLIRQENKIFFPIYIIKKKLINTN